MILQLVVMVASLLLGLLLLGLFAAVVMSSERHSEAERLNEIHNNLSAAEQQERLALLYRAGEYTPGSVEYNHLMQAHANLTEIHKVRWAERVSRIVDLEVR